MLRDTGYRDILKEDITPSTSSYYNHAPPEFLSPRIYAFEPPSIMYRDFEKRQIAEEEDDVHDWAPMFTGNEDDVSFSDLEGYDE
ncbi:hypothetical protein F2Q68_00019598 [Brassica cretica]|uniref:Uncharacterized protein n=1 Tax=Brassica cretica TaxID=69181 RepID=A0A8S9G0Y2_BRACR|nr:hypothetical protein F2Q68_00019598 [Brassica cretica]